MKKTLLTLFFVFLSLVFVYGSAHALNGVCSGCHTMHDSQGGSGDEGDTGALDQLVNAGCPSCHLGDTGDGVESVNDLGAPVILQDANPGTPGNGNTNAGGDFYWIDQNVAANESMAHNVLDLGHAADVAIGVTPPGWDYIATQNKTVTDGTTVWALEVTGNAGVWAGKQLTCSGMFGCHGARDAEGFPGLTGAHHGNVPGNGADNVAPAVTQGTIATTANSPGSSYRFLLGIKGIESDTWNFSETDANHNDYYGADDQTAQRDYDAVPDTVYTNTDTMSFFCGECHGVFHSEIGSDTNIVSPWRRHPTDIVLLAAGETSIYNTADGTTIGTYNLQVPVARGTLAVPTVNTVVANSTAATGGIVMCLSCHRAHGSEQPDLLRWDYGDMIVNDPAENGGCFVCHTDKNAAGVNP